MAKQENMTANMPIAIEKYSTNKSFVPHFTTSNFMSLDVAFGMEIVPDHSVNIGHKFFSRLEPLAVPTLGQAVVHKKAFFVPYRCVWNPWNDFITDSPHSAANGTNYIPTNPPMISNHVLVQALASSKYSSVTSGGSFDFRYAKADGTLESRNFNTAGKKAFKTLRALGYAPDFSLQNTDFYHNALNLLCLAKVYCDWYYPSQYIQNQSFHQIQALFQRDEVYNLSGSDVSRILDLIQFVGYEDDFFVNTWDKPNGPNFQSGSAISITSVGDGTAAENQTTSYIKPNAASSLYGSDDSPVMVGGNNTDSPTPLKVIRFQDLENLHALTDYCKRHQLVGSRALDRYMARYGLKLTAEQLRRSQFIAGAQQDIEFSDVMSTADTDGANLGQYAGRGITFGDLQVNFEKQNEYGYLVILTSIIPVTGYYQGADYSTCRVSRLDYWIPEFSDTGVQALPTRCVYAPMDEQKLYNNSTPSAVNYNEKVFGFIPRDAFYKRHNAMLTGDWLLGSRNIGKDAWHLLRNLDYTVQAANGAVNFKHDFNFILANDKDQYQRIFQNMLESEDQFNICHYISIDESLPMSELYDTYNFRSEDNAKKVNVDLGGVKAN